MCVFVCVKLNREQPLTSSIYFMIPLGVYGFYRCYVLNLLKNLSWENGV